MAKQGQKRLTTELNRIFCIKLSFDRAERKSPEQGADKDREGQQQNDDAFEIELLTNPNDSHRTCPAEEAGNDLILILLVQPLLYWKLPHSQSIWNSLSHTHTLSLSLLSLSKTATPKCTVHNRALFSHVSVVERQASQLSTCDTSLWSRPLILMTTLLLTKSTTVICPWWAGCDEIVALFFVLPNVEEKQRWKWK